MLARTANEEGTGVQAPVTVVTKQGTLRGDTQTSKYSDNTFYSFKGVPYAKPPLGDLRFKSASVQAPQDPEPWEGVKDALKEAAYCKQAGDRGSEDCLVLNVYTPNLPSDDTSDVYCLSASIRCH
uniref:Carboxylesterase type B domain-containing protein n=1 Tax=Timema cristinae TaxID=61476 RepID=A0A7R9HE12_TIMCR|nr:unnamed protein product [Timema cristinae]